jgi:hypothetical protein
VALKKNRRGTLPTSKMSDNEHATAALGYSKELSVENSVGNPIPEFDHAPEDGTKVPSSIRRQYAGDVLPDQPSGPCAISKPKKFERQVATAVSQSASEAGDTERLAGGSSDKKVNWSDMVFLNVGEVAEQRRGIGLRAVAIIVEIGGLRAKAMLQHRAWEGFDLAETSGGPAQRMPSCRGGLDAAANGKIPHRPNPIGSRSHSERAGSKARRARSAFTCVNRPGVTGPTTALCPM